jgi:6-phosphofructokinase
MKKPSKTAAELEASIKVEMEDICELPTDVMITVQPDGDSWKVVVVQEGSVDDADRREMVEQIAARLKAEYDLKG